MAAAAAPAIISGVAKAGSALLGALLAAHKARLAGAKTENAAVAQVIAPFDDFVKQAVQYYNTGQVDASTFINYVSQFDATLYSYMKSFVGHAGTAWNDQTGMAGKCDKTCTAACCVYFGDLGPVLSNLITAAGGKGKWGANDPRLSVQAGGAVIQVPEVFASKYGGVDRKGYQITLLNIAQRGGNPAPFAQTGMNTPSVPLGRISEGTPAGQTPTFAQNAQAGLVNASVLASAPGLTFSAPVQSTGASSGLVVIGLGVVAVIAAVALAMSRK
jgi:hypothetical protein